MTDRDDKAATPPEHDDVPREPSKHEFDDVVTDADADAAPAKKAAKTNGKAKASADDSTDIAGADDVEWPEDGADETDRPLEKYPPAKPAIIAGGILAALLIALAILAAFQDPKSYMADINRQQVAGVAQVLKDNDVASYTTDEIAAAQQVFADGGADRDMTDEITADALNAAKPDSVTPAQIRETLEKVQADYQTVEALQSGLRSQIILFSVTGLLMTVGTVFYQRGKAWGRFIGMFVSGFVAVMYIMQIVNGALNIPGLVITLASAAAFFFFMKGRLEELPPRPVRPAGGGGLFGGMFGRGNKNSGE